MDFASNALSESIAKTAVCLRTSHYKAHPERSRGSQNDLVQGSEFRARNAMCGGDYIRIANSVNRCDTRFRRPRVCSADKGDPHPPSINPEIQNTDE